MADYYQYDTDSGVITVDTGTVQIDVQNEFKVALGQNLDLSSQTPQGRMIDGETSARTGVLNYTATIANQINPDVAGGVFLASVFSLMGGSPFAATPTVMYGAKIWGVQGTVVPSLTIYDRDNNQYNLQTSTTIDTLDVATGKYYGLGTFQAVTLGPIAAPAGTTWLILSPFPAGVDKVTCDNEGVVGVTEESDVACRQRRKNTLARQGVNSARSSVSKVSDLPGFKSCSVRENDKDTQQTVDGVLMPPNSLWVCVQGATDSDIAAALLSAKGGGCQWTVGSPSGSFGTAVTKDVIDSITGQKYRVQFTRPNIKECSCVVEYDVKEAFGNYEPQNAIVDAITKYMNGKLSGDPGMVIGRNLSAFELSGAVSTLYPGLYISNCTVSISGGSQVFEINADIWELITIPVGQIVAQPRS